MEIEKAEAQSAQIDFAEGASVIEKITLTEILSGMFSNVHKHFFRLILPTAFMAVVGIVFSYLAIKVDMMLLLVFIMYLCFTFIKGYLIKCMVTEGEKITILGIIPVVGIREVRFFFYKVLISIISGIPTVIPVLGHIVCIYLRLSWALILPHVLAINKPCEFFQLTKASSAIVKGSKLSILASSVSWSLCLVLSLQLVYLLPKGEPSIPLAFAVCIALGIYMYCIILTGAALDASIYNKFKGRMAEFLSEEA